MGSLEIQRWAGVAGWDWTTQKKRFKQAGLENGLDINHDEMWVLVKLQAEESLKIK